MDVGYQDVILYSVEMPRQDIILKNESGELVLHLISTYGDVSHDWNQVWRHFEPLLECIHEKLTIALDWELKKEGWPSMTPNAVDQTRHGMLRLGEHVQRIVNNYLTKTRGGVELNMVELATEGTRERLRRTLDALATEIKVPGEALGSGTEFNFENLPMEVIQKIPTQHLKMHERKGTLTRTVEVLVGVHTEEPIGPWGASHWKCCAIIKGEANRMYGLAFEFKLYSEKAPLPLVRLAAVKITNDLLRRELLLRYQNSLDAWATTEADKFEIPVTLKDDLKKTFRGFYNKVQKIGCGCNSCSRHVHIVMPGERNMHSVECLSLGL